MTLTELGLSMHCEQPIYITVQDNPSLERRNLRGLAGQDMVTMLASCCQIRNVGSLDHTILIFVFDEMVIKINVLGSLMLHRIGYNGQSCRVIIMNIF